jgi:hypothetical protein
MTARLMGVVFSGPAAILVKDHVHGPMKAIFDAQSRRREFGQ